MIESIRNRRTIRKYQTKDVETELLHDLLELSSRASTMGNLQLYSIVITRDAKMKERLSPAHFNQPMVTTAPVVLTFCADFNRVTKWCEERDAVPGYNNFNSFLNAAMDALIVAQTFCTIAEEKGLGICYLGTTTYNPGTIIDTLQLPKLVFPITTITVGYPDETPEQPDRLPLEAIIHEETYSDYTTEKINQLYAFKESLEASKGFVELNKKKTLAQIFTDIRYSEKDNKHFSEVQLKVLKEQGFL